MAAHVKRSAWYAISVVPVVNKLMEASMALLQASAEKQMNIVVLNKALFYLDVAALRDFGRVVTGQKYFALPMGPVVDKYDRRVVRALEKSGLAEQVEDGMAKPVRVLAPVERFDLLTDDEEKLATAIGAFASKFTSKMLSDYSHKNPGWILARNRVTAERPAPEIDMRLAMQQLVDADPWVDDPIDLSLQAAIEDASAAATPWK